MTFHRWCTVLALLALAFSAPAQSPGPPELNVVHPLPPQSPAWLPGYQVRWPIRVLGNPAQLLDSQSVLVSLPTGGWLKADGSDLAVQGSDGKLLAAAVLSHDPLGETIVQFKRRGNDSWYWIYGVHSGGGPGLRADPKVDPAFREGTTLEVREWGGTDLKNWAAVRAGLEKSPVVLGNAIVSEVVQVGNPARPTEPQKFAASYRGYLKIQKEGTYRFLLNAEDAAFLFIDGFKVYEQFGGSKLRGAIKVKDLETLAGKVDLKPGVHSFEVHHAVGTGPDLTGRCALSWMTPEQPRVGFVGATAFAHPLYARAAALEKVNGEAPGPFAWGLDDALDIPGIKIFLVRFEAQGPGDSSQFVWDFGDGTTGTGRSVSHVYFKEGEYQVALTAPSGLPTYKRRIQIWPEPGENNPLTLDQVVRTVAAMDWKKLDINHLRSLFAFLQVCDQPHRFQLLDEVAQKLLAQKDLDPEQRSQLEVARMEALTALGKPGEALKRGDSIQADFAKFPALQVRLQLAAAAIHQDHYKDAAAASKIYKSIIDEHRRTEHPNLRVAAIRWGDLFAEAGDLAKADETYRIAATLGGDKFTAPADATTRGALLRIAEQKLKAGDHFASRQLLERLEIEYPGRRLDGLYCFLRAEADRFAGNYESALKNYEMIFKLPQWAGYLDRATQGLAETYLRLGDPVKARNYLTDLKNNFPKFFASHKGPDLEKLIDHRLDRLKWAKGAKADQLFTEFRTNFEPEETTWFGDPKDFAIVRGPGLFGPHAGLFDAFPRELVNFDYQRPLKNLNPGGHYVCELWYRDLVKPPPPLIYQLPAVNLHLIGGKPAITLVNTSVSLYRNTHHQWHKVTLKFIAPQESDLTLKIYCTNIAGHYLIDGLSIRPVSDRQFHALTRFQEGGKAP